MRIVAGPGWWCVLVVGTAVFGPRRKAAEFSAIPERVGPLAVDVAHERARCARSRERRGPGLTAVAPRQRGAAEAERGGIDLVALVEHRAGAICYLVYDLAELRVCERPCRRSRPLSRSGRPHRCASGC